ncbi:MAG: hypothetical protein CVV27_16025 [Candidatus Melainabacteria bacterium HGW-Melainabacteria-1]|nr:MAG: hypothetical protein CVV27_16025 [Candidatus Melainabacteria bacterium HGW-Melainabacteria-1]
MKIEIPFGQKLVEATLPEGTDLLRMAEPEAIANPAEEIAGALARPIGCEPLAVIAADRAAQARGRPRACVVVSDNTRPVPYKGADGILMPLVRTIANAGFAWGDICILVATGTHRALAQYELEAMLGPEPFELGIEVVNHDSRDASSLVDIGTTARGTKACINRRYVEADLKILTGLVESHFMAGASGGRKAICPGIFGEEGTFVFHSAKLMADPNSCDLQIKDNPVHEESLAVAKMAGVDFIANVTLDGGFRITGVFFGELEAAHAAAVAKLKSYVGIPTTTSYDLIITHGGYVAMNHYQSAKAAVASLGALAQGGSLVMVADHRDPNPIGSDRYRTTLSLLKIIGAEAFDRVLASSGWTFIPDQWQVQMWAKVFKRIAMHDFVYFAPQLDDRDWRDLPGTDGRNLLSADRRVSPELDDAATVIERAVAGFLAKRGFTAEDVAKGRCRIAWLADGPYGIPVSTPGNR